MTVGRMALSSLLLISALCSVSMAQVPDPQEAAIRAARDKWNGAIAKRDVTVMRELLSDSFHGVGGRGHIPSRDALLAAATKLFTERPDLFYEYRPLGYDFSRTSDLRRNTASGWNAGKSRRG